MLGRNPSKDTMQTCSFKPMGNLSNPPELWGNPTQTQEGHTKNRKSPHAVTITILYNEIMVWLLIVQSRVICFTWFSDFPCCNGLIKFLTYWPRDLFDCYVITSIGNKRKKKRATIKKNSFKGSIAALQTWILCYQ